MNCAAIVTIVRMHGSQTGRAPLWDRSVQCPECPMEAANPALECQDKGAWVGPSDQV